MYSVISERESRLDYTIERVIADFELMTDWEDRYSYLIELGKGLPEFSSEDRTEHTMVHGCVSQVWMSFCVKDELEEPTLLIRGASDSTIVCGIIFLLILIYSEKPLSVVKTINPEPVFEKLKLREHLTPQRSNGISALILRINQKTAKLSSLLEKNERHNTYPPNTTTTTRATLA